MTSDENSPKDDIEIITNNPVSIRPRDMLAWIVRHRMAFLLIVVLCSALATLLYLSSSEVYQRESSFTLKYNEYGQPTTGDMKAFQMEMPTPEKGLLISSTEEDDEEKKDDWVLSIDENLMTFQSLPFIDRGIPLASEEFYFGSYVLFEKIASDLGLQFKCLGKDAFGKYTDLYGKEPVRFDISDFDSKELHHFSFELRKQDDSTHLVLSHLEVNDEQHHIGKVVLRPGQAVKTPEVTIHIVEGPAFADWQPGQVLRLEYASLRETVNNITARFRHDKASTWATVVNFKLRDNSLTRANDILNYLPIAYNELWSEYLKAMADKSLKYIDSRLPQVESMLEDTERALSAIHRDNSYSVDTLEARLNAMQLSYYNTEQFKNESILLAVKSALDTMEASPHDVPTAIIASALPDTSIQRQIVEYDSLYHEYIAISSTAGENNPKLAQRRKTLIEMRSNMTQAISHWTAALDIQIRNTDRKINELKQRTSQIVTTESSERELQRNQVTLQALYITLLRQREACIMVNSMDIDAIRIIRTPTGSEEPVQPTPALFVLLAVILIFVVTLLCTATVYLTRTLASEDELTRISGLNVIGRLPQRGKLSRKNRRRIFFGLRPEFGKETPEIVVTANNRDASNEAFRVLRTNIDFIVQRSAASPLIAITSATRYSGKTYTAVNLGAAFALRQKRVLVIDADFYNVRGISSSVAGGGTTAGFTDLLNDLSLEANDTILRNKIAPGCDFLPAGQAAPNIMELLAGDSFSRLMDKLKSQYDYIILDLAVATQPESKAIIKAADVTTIVERIGISMRTNLTANIAGLKDTNATPYAILNGCNEHSSDKYGGYTYGE